MLSQTFDANALTVRPFNADPQSDKNDIGRVLTWAVLDTPDFIATDVRNNAVGAAPVVRNFLGNPDGVMAIEPSAEFKKLASITMAGAIGALDTRTGRVYVDPSYASHAPVRAAVGRLASQYARPTARVA